MIIFLSTLTILVKSQYYTETEINTICSDGNADSDPPSLSPGNTTISRISKFKSKIFLNSYFNEKDRSLTNEEYIEYADDLMPYSFLLYFSFLSFITWIMYISCIICKCCYCITGPATRVQTRKEKLCPLIMMIIVIICLITFSASALFYVSQVQGSIGYLVCVAGRWSGGYFYGYNEWKGIKNLNNFTEELIFSINETADVVNQKLKNFHNDQIKNVTQEMEKLFNSFIINWNSTEDTLNPNHGSYSDSLPRAYNCSLCKKLNNYPENFSFEVGVEILPLSLNLTRNIDDIFQSFVLKKDEIMENFRKKYEWTERLTELYLNYEEKNLPFFQNLGEVKDGMYGNTLFMISCTILMMFFQAIASLMVYLNRFKWRKWLHIGWCCYSILMIFRNLQTVFTISGLIFISTLVQSEVCQVFSSIVKSETVGSVFVRNKKYSNASSAIDFCHNNDGDFSVFLNLTSEFEFLPMILSEISNTLSSNFSSNYTIPTLETLTEVMKKSDVSEFLSISDNEVFWRGPEDVNFFLFEGKGQGYDQNSFLNDFTIFVDGSQQAEFCSSVISMDFWAFDRSFCESGYLYQYVLDPTSTSDKRCYIMTQEHSLAKVKERYVDRNLFENCEKVNSSDFDSYIMKYWNWGNNAYFLNKKFEQVLGNMSEDFNETKEENYQLIDKVYLYYVALDDAFGDLLELEIRNQLYFSSMNCSMVRDLTFQFYLGLCGEILDFMFFLSIYVFFLAFCNFFFSLSIVLILFRYRTDLEIEQERVIRKIGESEDKSEDKTERADETAIIRNNIN